MKGDHLGRDAHIRMVRLMGVSELFSSKELDYFKEQIPSVSDISFLSIPRIIILFLRLSKSPASVCQREGVGDLKAPDLFFDFSHSQRNC